MLTSKSRNVKSPSHPLLHVPPPRWVLHARGTVPTSPGQEPETVCDWLQLFPIRECGNPLFKNINLSFATHDPWIHFFAVSLALDPLLRCLGFIVYLPVYCYPSNVVAGSRHHLKLCNNDPVFQSGTCGHPHASQRLILPSLPFSQAPDNRAYKRHSQLTRFHGNQRHIEPRIIATIRSPPSTYPPVHPFHPTRLGDPNLRLAHRRVRAHVHVQLDRERTYQHLRNPREVHVIPFREGEYRGFGCTWNHQ